MHVPPAARGHPFCIFLPSLILIPTASPFDFHLFKHTQKKVVAGRPHSVIEHFCVRSFDF